MSCLYYHQNELYIEKIRLYTLAAEFGTPCYIYSRAAISANWHAFQRGLHHLPHRICYAVKANSNLTILNLFAQWRASFDIVSIGELERVLAAGGQPNQIIFSGVGKNTAEIARAIDVGIHCFNVESIEELHRLNQLATQKNKTVNFALRINPNVDAKTHHYISTGLKENKFGIDLDEVLPLCQTLTQLPAVRLIGIACHIGSQITELSPFLQVCDTLLALYQQLQTLSIQLQHINIGGGLGIQYHHENPPEIIAYTQAIREKLAACPLEIILEPGRSLVGNAGILLTRVEYLKTSGEKQFAIVDAGMNDLLRPALYHAWQPILPVIQRDEPTQRYDIAGPVCESADFLGKDRELAIQTNDLLAIDMCGAYGFSMSSNYNSRCRLPEILVEGNQAHLIRRREIIEDLFASEIGAM
ncbi:MAG TPA: diaminopimelate decarboxylase [Gammaproteobacteria bacterium]|jgi:diaminopimelate decarboxylase|nr:diaminopimelate decarboxylase [Gammaproteobacteria bacterium]